MEIITSEIYTGLLENKQKICNNIHEVQRNSALNLS